MLVLSALAVATAAPTAAAGPLVESAPPCEQRLLERPFARWLDFARYELAPGGRFEGDAEGWTLSGAGPVDGNEPFRVHDPDDGRSLEILPGGRAQTPAICVGLEHPTLRFFARRSGSPAPLTVEVLFEDALGAVQSLPIGVLTGHSSWAPTLPLPIVANLLPLLPGEHTPVAFRFSAGAGASWQLDDVNVDPYRK